MLLSRLHGYTDTPRWVCAPSISLLYSHLARTHGFIHIYARSVSLPLRIFPLIGLSFSWCACVLRYSLCVDQKEPFLCGWCAYCNWHKWEKHCTKYYNKIAQATTASQSYIARRKHTHEIDRVHTELWAKAATAAAAIAHKHIYVVQFLFAYFCFGTLSHLCGGIEANSKYSSHASACVCVFVFAVSRIAAHHNLFRLFRSLSHRACVCVCEFEPSRWFHIQRIRTHSHGRFLHSNLNLILNEFDAFHTHTHFEFERKKNWISDKQMTTGSERTWKLDFRERKISSNQ